MVRHRLEFFLLRSLGEGSKLKDLPIGGSFSLYLLQLLVFIIFKKLYLYFYHFFKKLLNIFFVFFKSTEAFLNQFIYLVH